jgi:hypothetical protein
VAGTGSRTGVLRHTPKTRPRWLSSAGVLPVSKVSTVALVVIYLDRRTFPAAFARITAVSLVPRVSDGDRMRKVAAIHGSEPETSGFSTDPPPFCARCGERIGIYERLGVEQAGGKVRSSSYLNLVSDERDGGLCLWHWQCLAAGSLGEPEF